jgi:dihydrofolate reductase
MRKLILEEWLSLDGFAADKAGELNFFPSTEANKYSDADQLRFLDRIDTLLLGRKTYELFAAFWPAATTDREIIADKLNAIPDKVVFSSTLQAAPWGKFPAARIVADDAVQAVRELKARPGKDMVLWGSLTLAQSLMRADLVDEFHLQICPTVVGGGRRLFPSLEVYKTLRLAEIRKYDTGVVFLTYHRPA